MFKIFSLSRPRTLTLIAILMILFGLAEVVTGITHQFFGVTTSQNDLATYAGIAIGLLYVLSGCFIWPMQRWGAALAMACLAADVAGRIAMVMLGLYPLDTPRQTFAIFMGTLIAVVFAIYIALRWKSFR
jgi:hypothetical protein